jgi:hypothetical protein
MERILADLRAAAKKACRFAEIERSAILLGAALFFLIGCRRQLDGALESFQIHPAFEIELAAKEPVVFDPVDVEFDEHGRAFVLEMPGYPSMKEPSRVILLGDKNREILLSGFVVENPQHNINGLTYGLDNWIYGANGGNSGNVYWPGDSLNRIPLRDDDFRFDLEERKLGRLGASAGGFGITFDDWGRLFGTHNLEHISLLVIPGRYLAGMASAAPGTRTLISDHDENGLSRIYPIGPQETRVNHPEQAGYFSGACGITCYTGGAFLEAFNGNVFVADVVLNLVHHDIVKPNGASLVAS